MNSDKIINSNTMPANKYRIDIIETHFGLLLLLLLLLLFNNSKEI
jgi:hypothetical protein